MTYCSLSQLFAVDRPAAQPICTRHGATITHSQLAADVAWNAHRIRATGCQRILLTAVDAYWGAVGLLAVAAARAEVTFAPNDIASTAERIGATCDLTITEDALPRAGRGLQLTSAASAPSIVEPHQGSLDPSSSITFHTSGSTGDAKLIVKTLHHLEREAAAIEELLGGLVPPTARIEATVPYQHAYGIAFRLIWPLTTGRRFAATTHLHLEACLAALDANTVFVTSPAHLTRLDGCARLPANRRPCLVLSAGAPLPQTAAQSCFDILGTAPLEIFGSTETGAIASRYRGQTEPDWTPLPGVQISRTEDGMLDAQADYIPRATHKTEDRIEIGQGGNFRFLGRKDDIVKIEGKRVSLISVERALAKSDFVAQAAVVVLAGRAEGRSDRLGAVVALSPSGHRLREDIGPLRFQRALQAGLRDLLEPAARPRLWRFVGQLPNGALGKRRPTELSALFEPPGAKE